MDKSLYGIAGFNSTLRNLMWQCMWTTVCTTSANHRPVSHIKHEKLQLQTQDILEMMVNRGLVASHGGKVM